MGSNNNNREQAQASQHMAMRGLEQIPASGGGVVHTAAR